MAQWSAVGHPYRPVHKAILRMHLEDLLGDVYVSGRKPHRQA